MAVVCKAHSDLARPRLDDLSSDPCIPFANLPPFCEISEAVVQDVLGSSLLRTCLREWQAEHRARCPQPGRRPSNDSDELAVIASHFACLIVVRCHVILLSLMLRLGAWGAYRGASLLGAVPGGEPLRRTPPERVLEALVEHSEVSDLGDTELCGFERAALDRGCW